VPFDDLPADLMASNFDNALAIPRKLRRVGFAIRRVAPGCEPSLLQLTAEQIEEMAKLEHARWNWQRILQNWTYKAGPKDNANKTTPYLVPWRQLSREIQQYDIDTVNLIPQLLRDAGYEAYRSPGFD
jgi:hypothetical protein